MLILATRYMGEPKPVCFEVAEGEAGIPIFETAEGAEVFAEAYRELLGSNSEALELSDHAMAQLLEKSVDETEWFIIPCSGTHWCKNSLAYSLETKKAEWPHLRHRRERQRHVLNVFVLKPIKRGSTPVVLLSHLPNSRLMFWQVHPSGGWDRMYSGRMRVLGWYYVS